MEWTQIKYAYEPEAREGASMVAIKDKYIILYGGINVQLSEILDKIWIFEIETKRWIFGKGKYH